MYIQGFGLLLLLLLFSVAFAVTTIVMSWAVHPKNPTPLKQTTYESGMEPIGESWIQFDVKFYLYALLFIVFDIEVVFLFPWAVTYPWAIQAGQNPGFFLVEMLVFIFILLLGLVYAWRREALSWQ